MGLLENLGSMNYAFDNNLPAILDDDSSNPTYAEYLHYRLNSGGIIVFNHPASEVSSLKENFCVAFYHVLRYVKNNIDAARAIIHPNLSEAEINFIFHSKHMYLAENICPMYCGEITNVLINSREKLLGSYLGSPEDIDLTNIEIHPSKGGIDLVLNNYRVHFLEKFKPIIVAWLVISLSDFNNLVRRFVTKQAKLEYHVMLFGKNLIESALIIYKTFFDGMNVKTVLRLICRFLIPSLDDVEIQQMLDSYVIPRELLPHRCIEYLGFLSYRKSLFSEKNKLINFFICAGDYEYTDINVLRWTSSSGNPYYVREIKKTKYFDIIIGWLLYELIQFGEDITDVTPMYLGFYSMLLSTCNPYLIATEILNFFDLRVTEEVLKYFHDFLVSKRFDFFDKRFVHYPDEVLRPIPYRHISWLASSGQTVRLIYDQRITPTKLEEETLLNWRAESRIIVEYTTFGESLCDDGSDARHVFLMRPDVDLYGFLSKFMGAFADEQRISINYDSIKLGAKIFRLGETERIKIIMSQNFSKMSLLVNYDICLPGYAEDQVMPGILSNYSNISEINMHAVKFIKIFILIEEFDNAWDLFAAISKNYKFEILKSAEEDEKIKNFFGDRTLREIKISQDFSYDDIPIEKLFEIEENRYERHKLTICVFQFNIDQLVDHLLSSDQPKNPYTRQLIWETREEFEHKFGAKLRPGNYSKLLHKYFRGIFTTDLKELIVQNLGIISFAIPLLLKGLNILFRFGEPAEYYLNNTMDFTMDFYHLKEKKIFPPFDISKIIDKYSSRNCPRGENIFDDLFETLNSYAFSALNTLIYIDFENNLTTIGDLVRSRDPYALLKIIESLATHIYFTGVSSKFKLFYQRIFIIPVKIELLQKINVLYLLIDEDILFHRIPFMGDEKFPNPLIGMSCGELNLMTSAWTKNELLNMLEFPQYKENILSLVFDQNPGPILYESLFL